MQEEIGDLADYTKTTDNEAVVKGNCQIKQKKHSSQKHTARIQTYVVVKSILQEGKHMPIT